MDEVMLSAKSYQFFWQRVEMQIWLNDFVVQYFWPSCILFLKLDNQWAEEFSIVCVLMVVHPQQLSLYTGFRSEGTVDEPGLVLVNQG